MKRSIAFLLAAFLPLPALAWGTSGHTIINAAAIAKLPSSLPDFITSNAAISIVGYLGPEEDRLKGSGESWDEDNDPAHYVDVGDDGTIGGVKLSELPKDLEGYDRLLAPGGLDQYRAGYLPYSIADGFEQLRKDFAYWRAFSYLEKHAASEADRALFAHWRNIREALVLRDAGVWGHFVGDGSQPLHVTVHYNGWGDYPNPGGYTLEHIHAPFEGAFVRDHVSGDAVLKLVAAPGSEATATAHADHLLSQEEVLAMTGTYLAATNATVPRLYDIEKAGGFRDASPPAIEFTTARVVAGAVELRDLIWIAWENSKYAKVGYPETAVEEILNGTATPKTSVFGGD